MSTTILANLSQVERQVPLSEPTIEALRTAIPKAFPCVKSHTAELGLRYIDDEGDTIFVTTSDELQEALCVGEKHCGILRMNLILPKHLIGKVVPAPLPLRHGTETSSEQEEPEPEPEATSQVEDAPEIITVLQKAGSVAIAEVNKAIKAASAEVSKVFADAAKKRADSDAQLASVTTQLRKAHQDLDVAQTEASSLREQIKSSDLLLKQSLDQKKADAQRIAALEAAVEKASEWEAKFHTAEAQRLAVETQLTSLRAGLLSLTGESNESRSTPAEIVSSEAVPSSPVLRPASTSEQPPPYPESPVLDHDIFPNDESPPTVPPRTEQREISEVDSKLSPELQHALEMVRNMGFSLTPEDLQSRYTSANGNVEVLINGLLNV